MTDGVVAFAADRDEHLRSRLSLVSLLIATEFGAEGVVAFECSSVSSVYRSKQEP